MTAAPTIPVRRARVARRPLASAFAIVIALMLALPAGRARGNGRFPAALYLTFGPGGQSPLMALGTTFGLLSSADGGRTWRFTCEEAVGFRSTLRWDIPLAITDNGAVVAGLPDGLAIGRDDRCLFEPPRTAPTESVLDLTTDVTGRRLAAAVNAPGLLQGVALSEDSGASWRTGWSSSDFSPITVDIAPADPQRLYASGYLGNEALVMRSDDGGASFVDSGADFSGSLGVYIAAVDPARADTVYVRSELRSGGTALLRSDDGGRSFRQLHHTPNPMTGVAFAPDGRTMWTGSPGGNPGDGIFRSADGGETWRRMSFGHTTLCLRYQSGVLYMCADALNDGFALGCSTDGGENFAAVLAWTDIVGPEGCPAGSPGRTACQGAWQALRSMLVPDGGQAVPSPGCPMISPDAGSPADVAMASPDAAASGGPGKDGPNIVGASDGGAPHPRDGCGCEVGGARDRGADTGLRGGGIVILAGLWLVARRRQRGAKRTPLLRQ